MLPPAVACRQSSGRSPRGATRADAGRRAGVTMRRKYVFPERGELPSHVAQSATRNAQRPRLRPRLRPRRDARGDDLQDREPLLRREHRPASHHEREGGIEPVGRRRLRENCAGFCAACLASPCLSRVKRGTFESCVAHCRTGLARADGRWKSRDFWAVYLPLRLLRCCGPWPEMLELPKFD